MYLHAEKLLDTPGDAIDVHQEAGQLYRVLHRITSQQNDNLLRCRKPAGIEDVDLGDGDPLIYEADSGAFDAHLAYKPDRGTLDVLVRGDDLPQDAVQAVQNRLQDHGYRTQRRAYLQ